MCINKIEIKYVQKGNFWKHSDVLSGYAASVNIRCDCCAKDVHTLPLASLDGSFSSLCLILRRQTFKRAIEKHRQEVMVGKHWSVVVGLDSLIRDAPFLRAVACCSFQVQFFANAAPSEKSSRLGCIGNSRHTLTHLR